MNQVTKHAVVFAYHDVGVHCLQALLDAGIAIDLVITHDDDPKETIWFGSVRELCTQHHIPYEILQRDQLSQLLPRLRQLSPDYIFSFYYRFMIPIELLRTAKIAALNMHGSLLPKYRGRAPVNWAVLYGEAETGATLHIMEEKPDAGDIVAQTAVPIEIHETAHEVFNKVSNAAKKVMEGVLPKLMKGEIPRRQNVLDQGSYFGGRKPEDGRIDWTQSAISIYNLIRAVAPPYPGAFTEFHGKALLLAKSSLPLDPRADLSPQLVQFLENSTPGLHLVDNRYFGLCGDGKVLELLSVQTL
ncbi:Fmt Methionyl-tRNA formyltransferase [Burkholderiaceae bacterium]